MMLQHHSHNDQQKYPLHHRLQCREIVFFKKKQRFAFQVYTKILKPPKKINLLFRITGKLVAMSLNITIPSSLPLSINKRVSPHKWMWQWSHIEECDQDVWWIILVLKCHHQGMMWWIEEKLRIGAERGWRKRKVEIRL